MELYNIKNKPEYIEEFILCCHDEWGHPWKSSDVSKRLEEKIKSTLKRIEKYPILILLDEEKLVGFISLFENDLKTRKDLTPWYSTLYIKEEYRGKHLSKKLNDALIEEAKKLGYKKLYLKTDLNNFYEKYGFKYLETVDDEKIYYLDLN